LRLLQWARERMNGLPLSSELPDEPRLRPIAAAGSDPLVVAGGAKVMPLFPGAGASLDAAWRPGIDDDEALVLRRELFERLANAGQVTIVSAPAGGGKTTLLRSWIAESGSGCRAAWTTVGRDERDSQRFWDSVIDALAGIADGDAPATRASDAPRPPCEVPIERLRDVLERIDGPAVLVIDDLHELQSAEALTSLERFLVHLPADFRVVLLTRRNPGLGEHRLRLTGELTELRAADLCFSLTETRELLAATHTRLSDAGTAMLHERTEGWAAGLRLATIALAGHPDPERFVAEFSGTERTVAAFLHAEVLDRQPPEVRDLLLRTSILERVNGSLADTLAGGSGSERILQELDHANAFVTACDVGRSWFRYGRMFADFLKLELRRANPTLVGSLHRTAARWLALNGHPVEAIRQAQAAGDWDHAARLLADHQLGPTLDGRLAEVRALLAAFPPEASGENPELALVVATALVAGALYEEAAGHLAVAEHLAAKVDADRRPAFDLAVAATKLRLACARSDLHAIPLAARSVEAALAAQPPHELQRTQAHRATALVELGTAELWSQRFDEASSHLENALELARRVQWTTLEIKCLSLLALVATLSGRPGTVGRSLAEQAASLADTCGCDATAAAAFAACATTLVSLGRLPEAEPWLERADRALSGVAAPGLELLVKHAWALLRLGQCRLGDALTAVREAERSQVRLLDEHPLTLDISSRALRARVRAGETPAVRATLERLSPDSRCSAEIRIAVAAVELSEGGAEQAIDELRPVIDGSAGALCHELAVIEALLYDAAARWEIDDLCGAEASLERALELAEPEGILLPFALVEIRELLERHRGHRTSHASLLSAILDLLDGSSPRDEAAPPLLDPLSDAELRVVRYLPGNLSAGGIAAELCISSNTVRTHLRHIYSKLDVHSRSEAVERARALRLLAPAL
jgi:LuxR family transcriptional regulator, maltose regulon positive regulatory protein